MTAVRAEAAAPSRPIGVRWVGGRLTGVVSFICFLLLWQLIVVVTDINPLLLPAPGSVVTAFVEVWNEGVLLPSIVLSLRALTVGLVLALVVGVVAGLVIGGYSWLDMLTGPYLWGFFATPRIALAPLVVLWLGFEDPAKIVLVFLSAVLPLILSVKEGVQTVDESLIRAARSFSAGKRDLFKQVVIPYTLPYIANGIRNAIARGFVGLLIVEMTVGSGGIGTQVIRSMRGFEVDRTARMFAFVAVLIVISLTLITLSRKFEERVSRWRGEIYV